MIQYQYDKIAGEYRPGQYPGEKDTQWDIPDDVRTDYSMLNSVIETKYSREYLKICAFYNKLFPALRSSGWITSSYNVPAFTAMEQERTDTGTGISSNFLKQIIDQTVSRIGTISYDASLVADEPTLDYIIYKDAAERLLRKVVRNENLVRMWTEVFHDAAILGFSHVFIDPVTHQSIKANDYEIGMFESQFTTDAVTQMLYRNYRFPTTSLVPYLATVDADLQKEIVESLTGRDWCDFKMYFDCPGERVLITVGSHTLPPIKYPFDKVQMITFCWDVGFSKVTSTSLFDLLYPNQREMNKVNAKIQQLIRLYKGSVPVFNNDVDLSMKAISNGSGEALYVNSARPIDSLVTVINPTPLDAQLSAVKTEIKTEMYELAGLQQVSFDMENFRSAAAVVAANQFNDTVFQAQMSGMAQFVAQHFKLILATDDQYKELRTAVNDARIELQPVIVASPLGNKNAAQGLQPDYAQMAVARTVVSIIKGEVTFETLAYIMDKGAVTRTVALTVQQMAALGVEIPDTMHQFLISAFIDAVRIGQVQL